MGALLRKIRHSKRIRFRLVLASRKLDNEVDVVGLHVCLVCRLVPHDLSASVALVDNDISALRIRQGGYGAQGAAAVVCSVTGIYIHVQRAKAKRAVIARGVPEREHLSFAVHANKSVIVFRKAFLFHITYLRKILKKCLLQPARIHRGRQARLSHRAQAQRRSLPRPASLRIQMLKVHLI